jgi:hypothetical protein
MLPLTRAVQLRTMECDDVGRVSSFLRRINGQDPTPNFSAECLRWKYLQPRPEWSGCRGFLLEKSGGIVGFGGVLPTSLQLQNGTTTKAATLIDWAGDPSTPGAGIMVMNKVAKMTGPMFIIGGSDAALRVLPNIGFRPLQSISGYACWLRPYKEFAKRPKTGRSLLRLAHGTYCGLRFRPQARRSHWEAKPLTDFGAFAIPLLNREPSTTECVPVRSLETLNYMLRCPTVKTTGFMLEREGLIAGYFLSATVGWESRLLDISIGSDEQRDWNDACLAVVHTLLQESEVCRIFAWASAPRLREALIANGFWFQGRKPLMLRDPDASLGPGPRLNLQMLDGEAAFLL